MGQLKKNIIYQTIYQILAILLPLITTPLVTRGLGADGLGKYSYTYAIISYFSIFALLSVNSYGTREISKVKASGDKRTLSKTFCSIYSLQIICSLFVIITYYICALFVFDQYKILFLIQGIHLFGVLFDVSWFYFGLEQFKVTVTRNIVVKIISATIIILFIKSPKDLYLYAIALIASNLVSNAILLIGTRKYVDYVKVSIKDISIHIKPNLILFIPVVAASIFNYTDKIMIGGISGTIQSGYYEAMDKIVNVPMACVSAIANVMFPRISALIKTENNRKKIDQYVGMSLMGVIWFDIACIFGMFGVATEFVPLFLGKDFVPAIVVVELGCLILLPKSFRIIINSECLLPNEKDKGTMISIILAAITNVIVNYLLIPIFGAKGAIFATIISEFVCCIAMIFVAGKLLHIKKAMLSILPLFIFGVLSYQSIKNIFACFKINNNILLMCIEIVGGGLVYIILTGIYYILVLRKFRRMKK